ncbi:hypothetical protein [Pseudomonas sp. Kh13]|uniref:hypothetical protein n=1 Tax=Pseudomonas sp. Kh13 TaxID=2093744 RepID=UPI001184112D|nr:hypothetical protein [Pseudomonas sp. Kh13]
MAVAFLGVVPFYRQRETFQQAWQAMFSANVFTVEPTYDQGLSLSALRIIRSLAERPPLWLVSLVLLE